MLMRRRWRRRRRFNWKRRRRFKWRRRRMYLAQIDSVPILIGSGGVEVICDRARIWTDNLHTLWFPTIKSWSVQIHITDIGCTWSVNLEPIGRTTLECLGERIVQSRCINLIIIVSTILIITIEEKNQHQTPLRC